MQPDPDPDGDSADPAAPASPSLREVINQGTAEPGDPDIAAAVEYLQRRKILAVTDSLLMIGHAAENGIDLKEGDVRSVLDMAGKVSIAGRDRFLDQSTAEIESRFWESSAHIACLIKPASSIALRERSLFLAGKKRSIFAANISHYKILAGVLLILTLITHSYYFVIGAMLADARESIVRFDQSRAAAFQALAPGKDEATGLGSEAVINTGNTCDALKLWRASSEHIAWLTFQRENRREIAARYDLDGSSAPSGATGGQDAAYRNLCVNDRFADTDAGSATHPKAYYIDNLNRLRVVEEVTQRAMSAAVRFRDVVGQFVLPLFYGMLGAVASIIRVLSLSIRQIRYSRAFRFEYGMQIPLGALAGATVGLVVTPETLNTAFGLTMLGAAFGFGYSVDVFFTLLDGLIGRLTQQGGETARLGPTERR